MLSFAQALFNLDIPVQGLSLILAILLPSVSQMAMLHNRQP